MCLAEGEDFSPAQFWTSVCWILITHWAFQAKDVSFPSSSSCNSLPLISWPFILWFFPGGKAGFCCIRGAVAMELGPFTGLERNKAELRASRPQLPEGRPTLEDGLRLKD